MGYAQGTVVLDDGFSLSEEYWKIHLKFSRNKLKFEMLSGDDFFYHGKDGFLGNILIMGYNTATGLPTVIVYVDPKVGDKHTIQLTPFFYGDYLSLSWNGS